MNVVLYSSGCPKCSVLKNKLIKAGIIYETFDDIDEMIKMGFTTVPMLEVDGNRMNFKEAVEWIKKGEK